MHVVLELIEMSSHMNAFKYVNILDVLFPSVRRIYIEEDIPTFRFVYDNCAVHTFHIVKEWFAQHSKIEVLDLLSKFPDFNLIENVWGVIANLWNCDHEKTKANLVAHATSI